MPIYVYVSVAEGCEHCRDGFEAMQSLSAEPLAECPECGGEVEKVPAAFGWGGQSRLSDGNIRDQGFQKWRKNSDGGYSREV